MIALPAMLAEPARKAGMSVPTDPNHFEASEFPHFSVFLGMQLGAPMPQPNAHWRNAEIIAKIPDDQIRTITFKEIIDLGFLIGTPTP